MITADHARLMARYNRWQNSSLLAAADTLGDAERTRDRGAFFGSIHATLSHLLWGDTIWMSRFSDWKEGPTDADVTGDLDWYSGAFDRRLARPMAICIVHFFNHQTHHRGQVHAMLTAAGTRPEATDLFAMPETD